MPYGGPSAYRSTGSCLLFRSRSDNRASLIALVFHRAESHLLKPSTSKTALVPAAKGQKAKMAGRKVYQGEVAPSRIESAQRPIPASFESGPKVGKDGVTIFRKNPAREAFDQRWRERIARGEDPLKNLSKEIEDKPPSSSYLEVWWRKIRGKERTRSLEKEAQEQRERNKADTGRTALLSREGEGDDFENGEKGEERNEKRKLHDRLRWGL